MATRFRGDAGTIRHMNYSAATDAATKTFTQPANFLLIRNTDASIAISVSFDAGSTFFAIPAGSTLSLELDGLKSYQVKSASGTPAVETLYGSEI